MKKPILILIIVSILLMGFSYLSTVTNIVYTTDQNIVPDSAYTKNVTVGSDSLPFNTITSNANYQNIISKDNTGATANLSLSSQFGNISGALNAVSSTGDISSGINNYVGGALALSQIGAYTPKSSTSISFTSQNNTLNSNSKILLSSGVNVGSIFKGVMISIAGGATTGRFIYNESNTVGHTGITYATPLVYVTQQGSLTDKAYVDQGLLSQCSIASLPSAAKSGLTILVTNGSATGGPCIAFSFGSHWIRVSDNVIIP